MRVKTIFLLFATMSVAVRGLPASVSTSPEPQVNDSPTPIPAGIPQSVPAEQDTESDTFQQLFKREPFCQITNQYCSGSAWFCVYTCYDCGSSGCDLSHSWQVEQVCVGIARSVVRQQENKSVLENI